jgi:hypothetical protein
MERVPGWVERVPGWVERMPGLPAKTRRRLRMKYSRFTLHRSRYSNKDD